MRLLTTFFLIVSIFVRAQEIDRSFYRDRVDTVKRGNVKIITRYNRQNKLLSREEFLNNKLHGTTIRYNYNEVVIEQTGYKLGHKNGYSKNFSETGVPTRMSHFKNDTLDGLVAIFSETGTLQSKESYSKGYKTGRCEYYYKSGKMSMSCFYDTVWIKSRIQQKSAPPKDLIVTSVVTGKKQTWYENGSKKSEEHYVKGKKNGPYKEWAENGKLKFDGNYLDDMRSGRQLTYHDNGNLKEDITIVLEYDSVRKFQKTLYNANYLTFDENKNPLVKGFYKNRKKEGRWQEFSKGKLTLDAEYKNGYKVNAFKTYYGGTGQLNEEAFYKFIAAKDTSVIEGISTTYYQSGLVASKIIYKDGRSVSADYFNDKGAISNKTEIKDSLVYRTEFFMNGNIERRSMGLYDPKKDITGQKLELQSLYYENGKLKQEFYTAWTPLKLLKEYNDSGKVVFQKYHLTDNIGIETDFYNSGALKTENLFFHSYQKTTGLQYVEWFENGKPKRFENYGIYQINWLSNGELYNCFAYRDYNTNLPVDTVMDKKTIQEIYNSLTKSTKRGLELENSSGKIFSTYDGSKTKIETVLTNGVLDQYLNVYYFSGKPMLEFKLKDGKLDGPYKFFLENGSIRESGNYCNGKLCGAWVKCYFNGDTLEHYEYSQPVPEKEYQKNYVFKKDYFARGYDGKTKAQLKSWYHYKEEKMDGLQTEYYPNGTLHYSKMMKNGVEVGPIKQFWQNSNLYDQYTTDSLGHKQGLYQSGYENGVIKSKITYTDNKVNGLYTYYWPNGIKRFEGNYELNKKTGEWINYDSTGVIIKTENFDTGKKEVLSDINICGCKTEQRKIEFAPWIKSLMDISRGDIWQFGFHESITKYMDKFFYVNYQTSSNSSGTNIFTSLDLISYAEISSRLPDKKGLQFIINPCYKFQEYSRIPINLNVVKNQPDETNLQIMPEMVSFKFDTLLLIPVNAKIKETQAYFKTSRISYTKKGIEVYDVAGNCFNASLLTNTKAIIEMTGFTPTIGGESFSFIQKEFLETHKVIKAVKNQIYGITDGKGLLKTKDDADFSVPISNILITANAFAAEIVLEKTAGTENSYKINNELVPEEKAVALVKSLFGSKGLFSVKKEENKLIISFLVKTKS